MISNDMFTLRRYKNLKRNKAEVETPTLQSLSEDNYDLPEIEQNNESFPLFINFLEASHIISLVASCKNVWCLLILFVFFLNQIYCIFAMQSWEQLKKILFYMFTLRRYKNLKRNEDEVETPTLQSLNEDNYDLLEIEQNNESHH